jgi:hypothetical protein
MLTPSNRTEDVKRVPLKIAVTNTLAIGFYERLGYRKVAQLRSYIQKALTNAALGTETEVRPMRADGVPTLDRQRGLRLGIHGHFPETEAPRLAEKRSVTTSMDLSLGEVAHVLFSRARAPTRKGDDRRNGHSARPGC